MKSFYTKLVVFVLLGIVWIPVVADDKPAKKSSTQTNPERFVRIKKQKEEAVALETSITRYHKSVAGAKNKVIISAKEGLDQFDLTKDGGKLIIEFKGDVKNLKVEAGPPDEELIIDLIGVVHVGEKAYYEQLNDSFKQYDALLYELVAPEGTKVEKGSKRAGFNPIGAMQNMMKSVLELEFQLDHIDYAQKNFVHADMSPTEMADSMKKNDESLMKIFFKSLGSGLAMQGRKGMSDVDLLKAAMSGDKHELRQVMASQISEMDQLAIIFNGKDGSTIIHHRNAKCFEVLDEQIKAGKRKIGIFYGAAHLPDMESRLLSDKYKMKAGKQKWLTAWELAD